MKQLNEFKNWADSVLNEFAGSPSKKEKAPIGADRDIAYKSQSKYAGYDKDQALELFISDKLDDMEARDLEQNKVINAQRRENDKLRSQLSTLGQEVQDIERDSANDHSEIERLRTLAGQTKSDAETKRISRSEVEALLNQAAQLQNKPGMTDEHYEELKKKIKQSEQSSPDKLSALEKQLAAMGEKDEITKRDFDRIKAQLDSANNNSVSRGDISSLMSQVEQLKNKSGISPEQFQEFKTNIENNIKTGTVDPSKLQELETRIMGLLKMPTIHADQINRLNSMADELVTKQTEIAGKEQELIGKIKDLEKTNYKTIQQGIGNARASIKREIRPQLARIDNLDNIMPNLEKAAAVAPHLPNQEELAALKSIPGRMDKIEPEIHKQEEINKHQDEKDAQHDEELKKHRFDIDRLSTSDYKVVNDKWRKDFRKSAGDTPQYSQYDKLHNREIQKSLHSDEEGKADPETHPKTWIDPKSFTHDDDTDITVSTLSGNVYLRAQNLLASHTHDNKPLSMNDRMANLKKVRMMLRTYIHNVASKVRSETGSLWTERAMDLLDNYEKSYDKMVQRLAIDSGIPVQQIGPPFQIYYNMDRKAHLPESTQQDINNLAENILGPQYSKYLK